MFLSNALRTCIPAIAATCEALERSCELRGGLASAARCAVLQPMKWFRVTLPIGLTHKSSLFECAGCSVVFRDKDKFTKRAKDVPDNWK